MHDADDRDRFRHSHEDPGRYREAFITARLLELGLTVLKPVGDDARYDLVIERDGSFTRVQCKTACVDGRASNVLTFPVCSSASHSNGGKRRYRGDVAARARPSDEGRSAEVVAARGASAPVAASLQLRCGADAQRTRMSPTVDLVWLLRCCPDSMKATARSTRAGRSPRPRPSRASFSGRR